MDRNKIFRLMNAAANTWWTTIKTEFEIHTANFAGFFCFNEAQTKHISPLCPFLSQLRFGFNWIANDRRTKGLHAPIKGLHEPLPHFHSPGTLESILAIKRLILKETESCFTKSMKQTNVNLSTKFLIM